MHLLSSWKHTQINTSALLVFCSLFLFPFVAHGETKINFNLGSPITFEETFDSSNNTHCEIGLDATTCINGDSDLQTLLTKAYPLLNAIVSIEKKLGTDNTFNMPEGEGDSSVSIILNGFNQVSRYKLNAENQFDLLESVEGSFSYPKNSPLAYIFNTENILVSNHIYDETKIQPLGATFTTLVLNAYNSGVPLNIIGLLCDNYSSRISKISKNANYSGSIGGNAFRFSGLSSTVENTAKFEASLEGVSNCDNLKLTLSKNNSSAEPTVSETQFSWTHLTYSEKLATPDYSTSGGEYTISASCSLNGTGIAEISHDFMMKDISDCPDGWFYHAETQQCVPLLPVFSGG